MDRRRSPDPAIPVPNIAWPTLGLFAFSLILWSSSTVATLAGPLPILVAVACNAIAVFCFFTVLHEGSHRTAGMSESFNIWLGRISAAFLQPLLGCRMFRFIHMQHHLNTNEHDGTDPDDYTGRGPAWTWPLRWATLDFAYFAFYLPKLRKRSRGERIEWLVTSGLLVGAIVALVVLGFGVEVLTLYVIPQRIAIFVLGYSFDFMPHHGLEHGAKTDKFKATRNRIGFERLMTPLMLYQNYHLVHHLHPRIPFCRYISAWRRNEDAYLDHGPALSTFGGTAVSVEEYRRRRGLSA